MSTEQAKLSTEAVGKKAVTGVKWSYASLGAGRIMSLVATSILARLLTPEQFGIVGYATVAMTYFLIFKDAGLGSALIQRQDDVEEAADTAFTLNLLLGIVLATILFLCAPLIAGYFSEPLVTQLLRVLSVVFVITPLGTTHTVLLRQKLDYKRKVVADLAGDAGKGFASIALALSGAGVWSLILGQVIGASCLVIAVWVVSPWRPKLRIDRKLTHELASYGASILGIDLLTTLNNNIDYLIIGRILGSTALGIYTLAYRLPELFVFNFLWVISSVIFPAYSLIQKDREALKTGFLTTLRYSEMILLPICVGLAISAESVVQVIYGDQWGDAVIVVRWLAISFLLRSIAYHTGSVYKAIGRPNIMLAAGVFNLVTTVALLIWGARNGLLGIAQAHFIASLLQLVVRLILAMRVLPIGLRHMWQQMRPAILAAAAMALPVLMVQSMITDWPHLIQLILQAGAGAATYASVLWVLDPQTVATFLDVFGFSRLRLRYASGS